MITPNDDNDSIEFNFRNYFEDMKDLPIQMNSAKAKYI